MLDRLAGRSEGKGPRNVTEQRLVVALKGHLLQGSRPLYSSDGLVEQITKFDLFQ